MMMNTRQDEGHTNKRHKHCNNNNYYYYYYYYKNKEDRHNRSNREQVNSQKRGVHNNAFISKEKRAWS